jgi:hypothetical protein
VDERVVLRDEGRAGNGVKEAPASVAMSWNSASRAFRFGLKGTGDLAQEDQAKGDVLVIAGLHAATQLVCRYEKTCPEPEVATNQCHTF